MKLKKTLHTFRHILNQFGLTHKDMNQCTAYRKTNAW